MARVMINKPKLFSWRNLAALITRYSYILKIQSVEQLVTDHNVKNLFDITDRSYVLVYWSEGTSRELLKSSKASKHYLFLNAIK